MTKLLAYCVVASLATMLAACDDSSGGAKRLAYFDGVAPSNLIAPDTVLVNTPFTVTALGWGSGSRACNDPAGTKVDYLPGVARIEAYMIYPTGSITCTDDLRSYPQTATLKFESAGRFTIRLLGLKSPQYQSSVDSIEKTVVVMPTR